MKILIRYISILLCLPALLYSCSSDEAGLVPEKPDFEGVEIMGEIPTFANGVGRQDIEFATKEKWTIRVDQSWCKVYPNAGNPGRHKVAISVEANDTPDERNTSVIFNAGAVVKRITVSQKQKNALLLTSSKAEISAEAQDVTFEVKANIDYEVTIDEKAASWITASKSRAFEARTHTFSISKNTKEEKRQGNIVIKGGEFVETFTIYQQAGEKPELVLSKKNFLVNYEQNEVKIELKSNTDYKMILPEGGWLKESPSRAMSSYTHYITVAENASHVQRSANILFVYGEKVDTVTVTQQQKDAIVLAQDLYEVAASGGTIDLLVSSNIEFDVKSSVEWIKPIVSSRTLEEKMFHFEVAKYEGFEERSGEIIFKGNKVEQKITVIQKGNPANGRFIFKHTGKRCEIPTFTGLNKVTGTIDWGDDSFTDYYRGLLHTYSTEGSYAVTVDLRYAQKVSIEKIKGISEIDISQF